MNDGRLDPKKDASSTIQLHPRWVRINPLRTSLEQQLSSTFTGYEAAKSLSEVMSASGSSKKYFIDANIPNLVAFPPKIDLSKTPAYTTGRIIFQDKASCFPAYLLDVKAEDGSVIDGCAAPGNKTTHLAATLTERAPQAEHTSVSQKVIAFERDKFRTKTLEKMVKLASADHIVSIKGGHDFMEAKPDSAEFADVGAILLDPSCSGSGIVGRDDNLEIHLPITRSSASPNPSTNKGKKRKHGEKGQQASEASATLKLELEDAVKEEEPAEDILSDRLHSLSTFQLRILMHAMRFPNARKISYSTCSIHFEENEGVVFRALNSSVARELGWRIMRREAQVHGLRKWTRRGIWDDGKLEDTTNIQDQKGDVLEACIRCEKGTEDGTMGFFVAAFVRDKAVEADGPYYSVETNHEQHEKREEDEWHGFSDEDGNANSLPMAAELNISTPKKKKRRNK